MTAYGRVVQSILTLGLGQVVSWLAALVIIVLVPRYFGDANLGKFAFASALVALFGLISDLGVTTYLAREVARDVSQVGSLTKAALLTRLPLSAVAAAAAAAFVWLAGYDDVTKQVVYVLCVGVAIGSIANALGAALQGLQRMRALTASMATGKLLQAALVAAILLNGAGPVEVALTTVFATALGTAVSAVALRRELFARAVVTRGTLVLVVSGGLPFFVWQAALMVYGQVDFVLLSMLTRDAVVGWYAAAYRLVMLPAFTPIIVTMATLPALAAASRDPVQFGSLARRSLQLVAVTTIPMGFGILLLPDKLIAFLGYPDSFVNSIAPMMLLALHVPLAGIDMVIGTVLATSDRQRAWALTAVAAAILNPAANLIAIPVTERLLGNGAVGAAAITTATELFMLVVGLRLLPRGVVLPSTVRYVGRCVFAALLMSLAVFVVRELPFLVAVGVGVFVYTVASFALKTLTVQEIRALASQVAGRGLAARLAQRRGAAA